MKRFSARSLGATILIASAVACSQYATSTVGVTKSEAVVAGCQKVGEVTASASTPDSEVYESLEGKARSQGANYVLVPSDGARTGSAYKCESPKVASH